MSALKKIGIIVGVGSVIAIGYYFLNKSKPKIAEEQLTELNKDTVTPVEEELAPKVTIEEQLMIDKCLGLSRSECAKKMSLENTNVVVSPTRGTTNNTSSTPEATNNTNSTNTQSTNTQSTNTTPSNTGNPRGSNPSPRVVIAGGRR